MKKPECCTLCDHRCRTTDGNTCGYNDRELEPSFDDERPAWCPLDAIDEEDAV